MYLKYITFLTRMVNPVEMMDVDICVYVCVCERKMTIRNATTQYAMSSFMCASLCVRACHTYLRRTDVNTCLSGNVKIFQMYINNSVSPGYRRSCSSYG